MSGLKLYDYWRSSAAYRVRIGLALKGVSHDVLPIDIAPGRDEQFSPDYRAKNPQARVPVLESELGVVGQSLAILEWLDETYPTAPLLPGDAWRRAQIRAFALTIACDIHPLNNLSVLARLRAQFGAEEAAISDWYVHWIGEGFAALEAQARGRDQTAFAFGEAPTLADVCLVPQFANARRYDMDLSAYPLLSAIDARARAHPAFQAAAPENQKRAG